MATVLAVTAVLGTQVLGVSAAPSNLTAASREALADYYEKNFDVEAYKAAYPDLTAAFGAEADDSVYLNHYLTNGMAEGRNAGGFDAIAFILNNYDYFMTHGLDANFPYFNVQKYMEANPDLKAAFGDNLTLYLNHYLNHGIFESRNSGGEIDIVSFAKEYPDAKISVNANLSDASVVTKVKAQFEATIEAGEAETLVIVDDTTIEEEKVAEVVSAGDDVVVQDKEDKVYYNVTAFNAAKEAWINSQPDINDYLLETGFHTAWNEWYDSEPDITDYLSEEVAAVYQEWLDSEPDYNEYLNYTEY